MGIRLMGHTLVGDIWGEHPFFSHVLCNCGSYCSDEVCNAIGDYERMFWANMQDGDMYAGLSLEEFTIKMFGVEYVDIQGPHVQAKNV